MAETATPAATQRGRGPHPLSLFLAMAIRLTAGDRERLKTVLRGVRRYQEAPLPEPMPEAPVVARRGTVNLRLIGGPQNGPPIVVVPSLINAAVVLDLAPGRSLVRYLAGRGNRVFMIDWGPLGRGERRLGLAGLVTQRLLPLVRALDRPPHLLGYCLGGTLTLAAARLLGDGARSLGLLAAPWHYSGYSDEARSHALGMWGVIRPVAQRLGAMPVSMLNPMFWSLDEEAVVEKYARLADYPPEDPHVGWFAAVEDWTNSGAPLSRASARDLFLHGYGADTIGQGRWKVGGIPVRPEDLACPVVDFVARNDRIVPPSARIRLSSADKFEVGSGHVGMIVGRQAQQSLWEPLSNWFASR